MIRWSVVVGAVVLHSVFASACASRVSNGGGSETGFLACSVDSDCETGRCVEATCVDDKSRNTLATGEAHAGTCDDPGEFTQSVPAWWQAEWTPSLPSLAFQKCGDQSGPQLAPAIVGKWTAPSAGTYWVEGFSRDMGAVLGYTRTCGAPDACEALGPQEVTDPPFDLSRISGFGFEAKTGETWFFSFQYSNWGDGGPQPDRGSVIVGIEPMSP